MTRLAVALGLVLLMAFNAYLCGTVAAGDPTAQVIGLIWSVVSGVFFGLLVLGPAFFDGRFRG